MILAGAAWLSVSTEALAQVQIMPTGPLALKAAVSARPVEDRSEIPAQILTCNKVYPGRTTGGGNRMLRSIPPPSFLIRRKE
jgi:hypothetical protein